MIDNDTILYRLGEQDKVLERQDKVLEEIRTQARRTNGRVRRLELWRARIEGARSAMSWVQPLTIAIVSGVVVAIIAGMFGHPL